MCAWQLCSLASESLARPYRAGYCSQRWRVIPHWPRYYRGGQGVHREVESEGLEAKLQSVIKAEAMMNRSAKTRAVADPALWGRRQILGCLVAKRCVRAEWRERLHDDPGRPRIVPNRVGEVKAELMRCEESEDS